MTISRDDIEFFVTSAEGKALPLSERVQMYQLLVLNRIEGHLERLATNTSETPELENIAGRLSFIGRLLEQFPTQ